MKQYIKFYKEAKGELPRIYCDMDGVLCDFVLAAKMATGQNWVGLRTGIAQALLDKTTPMPKIRMSKKTLFKKSLGKTKIEVNPSVDIGVASGGKNTGSGNNLG